MGVTEAAKINIKILKYTIFLVFVKKNLAQSDQRFKR